MKFKHNIRPKVDWYIRDLDDSSAPVSANSIFQDYARPNTNPRVYQEWIPLWLLSERLWEEVEEIQYPCWKNYTKDGFFPPIKIEMGLILAESMSYYQTIHIRDGNHRTRFWKRCAFTEAPAWVLDYR
jgi:hypothetical protein